MWEETLRYVESSWSTFPFGSGKCAPGLRVSHESTQGKQKKTIRLADLFYARHWRGRPQKHCQEGRERICWQQPLSLYLLSLETLILAYLHGSK
jgi:hypothetical protein